MNFLCGDGYVIAKPVPAPPRCHPCMRRCSGSTSLIPGPAGNYQTVIINREGGRQQSTQHLLVNLNQMLGNGQPYSSNTLLYIYTTNLVITFMSDKI